MSSRYKIFSSLGEFPVSEKHKYAQCKVIYADDGSIWLQSYRTVMCGIVDGLLVRVAGSNRLSVTTAKHVSWFRDAADHCTVMYGWGLHPAVREIFRLSRDEAWDAMKRHDPSAHGIASWD
jgi:hypothetical protein